MSQAMDPAVLNSFLEEVRGYLPALEQEAARLRQDPGLSGAVAEVHRLAHSIRSASEMIGLDRLAEAAREVEGLAGPAMYGEYSLDAGLVDRLEAALSALRSGLGRPEAAGPDPAEVAAAAPATTPGGAPAHPAATPAIADFDPVANELIDTFRSEAEQLLDQMDARLGQLRQDSTSAQPLLNDLRNHAHTLKGAAAMTGLETTALVAHRMEDVLDLLCAGRLPAEGEILDLLQASHDCLADLAGARGDNRALRPRALELIEQFDALLALCAEDEAQRAASGPQEPEAAELAAREETDPFLLDTFLAEAETNLAGAEAALRELAARPSDPGPALLAFRRAIHTIKGAAGMVGLMSASNVARRLQFLMDGVLGGTTPYTGRCLEVMSSSFDLLAELIGAQGENGPLLDRARGVLDEIQWACSPGAADAPPRLKGEPASAGKTARPAPAPPVSDQQMTVRVPVDRLAAISRTLGEIFMNASGFEQQIEAFRRELDELSLNLARIRRISNALVEAQESAPSAAGAGAHPQETTSSASEFDVLEFDRYTKLNLLARDLAEATSDLSSLSGQFQTMRAQFDTWTARQRGLSGEAQDKLMRLRMVPLSSLSKRLDRTVRVTSSKTGKLVQLTAQGLDTEFDKVVIEQLAPALEHLLRNAIDHGIEPPSERLALGKPEAGVISLTAARQGAHVTILLSDDGAGLDFHAIARRAVELEWMSPAQAESMKEEALIRLIFEPGFSTSEAVSEVSGRGVGMDIVRATVEGLRGRLSVQSAPGKGTTFAIVLPVSMAVDRVVILEAGGERLALPMPAMTRQMRVLDGPATVRDGAEGVEADGAWIPVAWLGEWLGLSSPEMRPGRAALVFVNNGEREIALVADRVIEAREVIVKPLTGLLARMTRYSGATILGDGSVVLILNPSAIDLSPAEALPAAVWRRRPARETEILIVDDSVSIRRSVANLLRSCGWRATQARDGLEALEMLEKSARLPDAILMDIEMPRMDGYELASRLRSRHEFDTVPILMLTSRAGEKHRQKALRLGVDRYLVKPCPDDLLAAEIRHALEEKRQPRLAAS